jgi:hypothetical protein
MEAAILWPPAIGIRVAWVNGMVHAIRSCARLQVATLLTVLALCGCRAAPGSAAPPAGVLTLSLTPSLTTSTELQLSGHLEIENLTVLGDVAPDARSMLLEFALDVMAARKFSFAMLPQGVYSGVHFLVGEVQLQGSWRGVPLRVQLDSDQGLAVVDLRASAGVELSPGHDAELPITVAVDSWFAGNLLDSASQSASQIVIDATNNAAIASQLLTRIAASFALHDQPIP